jgi:hypothetical protein
MALFQDPEERRRYQRFPAGNDVFAVAAGSVGRILNIGGGGLAFSYVLLQDTPMAIDRLDILYGGDHLLRDIPVQSLAEHRLDNKFTTSPVEVRRCRVAFGPLTEEQRRQMAALVDAQAFRPAAAPACAAG